MKILTQGNPWWVDLRVDCAACGCVATLDLENRPRVSYDPLSIKSPGVCCPTCGEWIHVPEPTKPVRQPC